MTWCDYCGCNELATHLVRHTEFDKKSGISFLLEFSVCETHKKFIENTHEEVTNEGTE